MSATAGPGPARAGINPAGMAAWLAGLAVGLVPTVADAAGLMPWWRLQPAALAAFVVAFAVYCGAGAARFRIPSTARCPAGGRFRHILM